MKQGKTEKAVFAKLSTEKVELASVNDLKEFISDADRVLDLQQDGMKWADKAKQSLKEVLKVVSDAEGIIRGANRQARELARKADKLLPEMEKSAKELGVSVNNIDGYSQAKRLLQEMDSMDEKTTAERDYLSKFL